VATTPRATAADALQLGRRRFLGGGRIDLSALAEELAVNRVTLYRWFGSRDGYLVELVWSLARQGLDLAEQQSRGRGPGRVVRILVAFLDTVITNPGMRRWMTEEGEHAMRLLTRHEHRFQPRLIEAVQSLLDAEQLEVPLDPHELAYIIVRVLESYTYLDLITGERPDASRAEPVLRMLLRVD
jgi:AcrR family transcriptional regulator